MHVHSLRSPRSLIAASVLLASFGLVHAQEFKLKDLVITAPVARATVPQQQAAGAYVTVENRGKDADRLVGGSTPAAKSVEMHSMALDGNVMRMREIDAIEVKPSEKIAMKPGAGFHLMLTGIRQPLKAGDKFPLTLQFEKAGKLEVNVTVEAGKGGRNTGGHHGH